MALAEDQTMFGIELCECHSMPAMLLKTHYGAYCFRCAHGGQPDMHNVRRNPGWVTIGSTMDVYNKLIDPLDNTAHVLLVERRN